MFGVQKENVLPAAVAEIVILVVTGCSVQMFIACGNLELLLLLLLV